MSRKSWFEAAITLIVVWLEALAIALTMVLGTGIDYSNLMQEEQDASNSYCRKWGQDYRWDTGECQVLIGRA